MSPETEIKKEPDLVKAEAEISSLKIADEKPKQKDNGKKKVIKKADGKQEGSKALPKTEEKKLAAKQEDKKVATKPVEKKTADAPASTAVDKSKGVDDSKTAVKLEEKDAASNSLPEKRASIPLIVRGVSGKVSWYSVNKGFGFIEREDGGPDVFVHSTAIVRLNRNMRILSEGERVEFDVINGHKGPEAAVVTGKGGRVVRGYTYMLAGQLRVSRGPRSSFRRNRQFKGRRGQTSDGVEEEGTNGTSSDESSSSEGDSGSSSETVSQSVNEKGDDANHGKGNETNNAKLSPQSKQDSKLKGEKPIKSEPVKN